MRGLMRLPVSVTDRHHEKLNVLLRAVWQQGPPVQAEAVLTLMFWGLCGRNRAGGWRLSYTPPPLVQILGVQDAILRSACNLA